MPDVQTTSAYPYIYQNIPAQVRANRDLVADMVVDPQGHITPLGPTVNVPLHRPDDDTCTYVSDTPSVPTSMGRAPLPLVEPSVEDDQPNEEIC